MENASLNSLKYQTLTTKLTRCVLHPVSFPSAVVIFVIVGLSLLQDLPQADAKVLYSSHDATKHPRQTSDTRRATHPFSLHAADDDDNTAQPPTVSPWSITTDCTHEARSGPPMCGEMTSVGYDANSPDRFVVFDGIHMAVMKTSTGEVLHRSKLNISSKSVAELLGVTLFSAIFSEYGPSGVWVFAESLDSDRENWRRDALQDTNFSWDVRESFKAVRMGLAKVEEHHTETAGDAQLEVVRESLPLINVRGNQIVHIVETTRVLSKVRQSRITLVECREHTILPTDDGEVAAWTTHGDMVYFFAYMPLKHRSGSSKLRIQAHDATALNAGKAIWMKMAPEVCDRVLDMAASASHIAALCTPQFNPTNLTKLEVFSTTNGTVVCELPLTRATSVGLGADATIGPVYVSFAEIVENGSANVTAYSAEDASFLWSTSTASRVQLLVQMHGGDGILIVDSFSFAYLRAETGEGVYNYSHGLAPRKVSGIVVAPTIAVAVSPFDMIALYTCVDLQDATCGWAPEEDDFLNYYATGTGAAIGLLLMFAYRIYLEKTYPLGPEQLRPPTQELGDDASIITCAPVDPALKAAAARIRATGERKSVRPDDREPLLLRASNPPPPQS